MGIHESLKDQGEQIILAFLFCPGQPSLYPYLPLSETDGRSCYPDTFPGNEFFPRVHQSLIVSTFVDPEHVQPELVHVKHFLGEAVLVISDITNNKNFREFLVWKNPSPFSGHWRERGRERERERERERGGEGERERGGEGERGGGGGGEGERGGGSSLTGIWGIGWFCGKSNVTAINMSIQHQ